MFYDWGWIMLEDVIRDKCAVFGIWGVEKASEYAYVALNIMQHRGQEHTGIVTRSKTKFYKQHGRGIVNDVFSDEDLKELKGRAAIGHNRYSTQGGSSDENAQPYLRGDVAVAHNGEFANYKSQKRRLQEQGCIFSTTSDTEIVLHTFARSKALKIEDKIFDSFKDLQPAYSIVMLTKNELIGIRDPSGVRPLVLGRLQSGTYVLASETVAFDIIDAKYDREIKPGELVVINDSGVKSIQLFEKKENLPCIFEHIYFSRPDSFVFGSNVTNSIIRQWWGGQLYREDPIESDVVMAVPDSSNDIALGYSKETYRVNRGIPFEFGFIRSHYIGRTFIEPTQAVRDVKVRKKFNPNRSVIEGKRVIVVDDSIVRGTTTKKIVKLLRRFGAKEIHLRISSPPYRNSCYLGIDTPKRKELIAYKAGSTEEVRRFIGADSLKYLSMDGLLANPFLAQKGYCTHCFDGIVKINRD